VILTTAAVRLSFDPFLRIADLAIPWRALAVAGAVLLALSLAAFLARRRGLRLDDLLLISLGAMAGAVIGGRALHALAFLNVYQGDPGALLDPARGSLSLLGAVVGGILAGAFIAGRLEGTLGGWADLAAAPVLLAIGLGKLAQLLAGAGQGIPFDGAWAIAFVGPGPWVSASPSTPAHPAQLYEGGWALVGLPVVLVLLRRASAEGRLLMLAVAWWLLGRIAAGFTWRDERLLGPMAIEQVLAVLLFTFSVATVASFVSGRRGSGSPAEVAADPDPSPGPSSTAGHDGGIVDPAGGPQAVGAREVSDDATG
jgi:prolipoprotein diacylglyceryltransferase